MPSMAGADRCRATPLWDFRLGLLGPVHCAHCHRGYACPRQPCRPAGPHWRIARLGAPCRTPDGRSAACCCWPSWCSTLHPSRHASSHKAATRCSMMRAASTVYGMLVADSASHRDRHSSIWRDGSARPAPCMRSAGIRQTLGFNHDSYQTLIRVLATLLTLLIVGGFAAIPLLVIGGHLHGGVLTWTSRYLIHASRTACRRTSGSAIAPRSGWSARPTSGAYRVIIVAGEWPRRRGGSRQPRGTGLPCRLLRME